MGTPKKKKAEVSNIDAGLMAMVESQIKTHGEDVVCLGIDSENKFFGIPTDHISVRWLLDSNIWPLSRIIGLAGMKESCKSAFAMSLAEMWVNIGGAIVYNDTENKKSAVLYRAFVGEAGLKRTIDQVSFTSEDWQKHISDAIEFATVNPNLHNVPFLFIVDSLGGVNPEEAEKKLEKEGAASGRSTSGMVKAKSHNEYFRHINKPIFNKPYNLIYVNHLSDDPMSPIQGAKRKPGGTGQDYHAVLDLWFTVVKGKPDYKKQLGFTQRGLRIKAAKNSLGASQRAVDIWYRWANDPETGELKKVWFDWDAATAELLANDEEVKARLDGVIHVTENGNRFSCQELGMVKALDYELGQAIRENVELREMISDKLGVSRHKVWDGLNLPPETIKLYEERRYTSVKFDEGAAVETAVAE